MPGSGPGANAGTRRRRCSRRQQQRVRDRQRREAACAQPAGWDGHGSANRVSAAERQGCRLDPDRHGSLRGDDRWLRWFPERVVGDRVGARREQGEQLAGESVDRGRRPGVRAGRYHLRGNRRRGLSSVGIGEFDRGAGPEDPHSEIVLLALLAGTVHLVADCRRLGEKRSWRLPPKMARSISSTRGVRS